MNRPINPLAQYFISIHPEDVLRRYRNKKIGLKWVKTYFGFTQHTKIIKSGNDFSALAKSKKKKKDLLELNGSLFLTQFSPLFHFYTPRKCQKTPGILTLSGGIEMENLSKMG